MPLWVRLHGESTAGKRLGCSAAQCSLLRFWFAGFWPLGVKLPLPPTAYAGLLTSKHVKQLKSQASALAWVQSNPGMKARHSASAGLAGYCRRCQVATSPVPAAALPAKNRRCYTRPVITECHVATTLPLPPLLMF